MPGTGEHPLIEPRSSRIPTVRWPSGPAALLQPRGLQLPDHTEPHQSSPSGRTPEMGAREGERELERERESLDGGIPYLLLRGCCSVVRDCLELPPVPGIFEGNTKACDGSDLLELPFFYVSLHFLLCYIPHLLLPFPALWFLSLLLTPSLLPSQSAATPFLLSLSSSDISHFTRLQETF